jgi:hypothetical protein
VPFQNREFLYRFLDTWRVSRFQQNGSNRTLTFWEAGFEGIAGRMLVLREGNHRPWGTAVEDVVYDCGNFKVGDDAAESLRPFFEKVFDCFGTRRPRRSLELPAAQKSIQQMAKTCEKSQNSCDGGSPEMIVQREWTIRRVAVFNYRHRMLHKLARELDLPKLTFQVIRRTLATLGKTKGHVKDIQGMMRHCKASTTTDVSMQSLEPEVRTAINSIYAELVGTGTTGPVPEQPITFGPNAGGREANHGAYTQARRSTMEPKNGSGREEKKIAAPSPGKVLQFGGGALSC